MADIPDHKWDIFISYAHRDCEELPPGWLNAFQRALIRRIGLGIDGKLNVFFDQTEQKAFNSIESIIEEVRSSAILVIFATPNWIKSPWCNEELKEFQKKSGDDTRIMIAEIEPPQGQISFPNNFPNNLRLPFYERAGAQGLPIPLRQDSSQYEINLRTLAKDIQSRLIEMRSQRPVIVETAPISQMSGRNVLMATSAGEVSEEHQQVVDYLESQHVRVLQPNPQPESLAAFIAEFDRLLAQADVFIQLLGRKKVPVGTLGKSLTDVQYERAVERGCKIFLWLPDGLDPGSNPDEGYRSMLSLARNGSAVPELSRAVLTHLGTAGRQPPPPDKLFVLVSADREDLGLASELIRACRESNCLLLHDDSEVNDDAREQWATADAIAFVQGSVPPRWLTSRYFTVNKERARAQASANLQGQVAIYAPPPPKTIGLIGGGNLSELDMSQQWEPAKFAQWVEAVAAKSGKTG